MLQPSLLCSSFAFPGKEPLLLVQRNGSGLCAFTRQTGHSKTATLAGACAYTDCGHLRAARCAADVRCATCQWKALAPKLMFTRSWALVQQAAWCISGIEHEATALDRLKSGCCMPSSVCCGPHPPLAWTCWERWSCLCFKTINLSLFQNHESAAGLDSLGAVELRNSLEGSLQMQLPGTLVFDYPSVSAITEVCRSLTRKCYLVPTRCRQGTPDKAPLPQKGPSTPTRHQYPNKASVDTRHQ